VHLAPAVTIAQPVPVDKQLRGLVKLDFRHGVPATRVLSPSLYRVDFLFCAGEKQKPVGPRRGASWRAQAADTGCIAPRGNAVRTRTYIIQ
jgi:hypothetical protein